MLLKYPEREGVPVTNYVSPGIYQNYLEKKFYEDGKNGPGVGNRTFRNWMQNNSSIVMNEVNKLSVVRVNTPSLPQSTLNVAGEPVDSTTTPAPVGYSQSILGPNYVNTMLNRTR